MSGPKQKKWTGDEYDGSTPTMVHGHIVATNELNRDTATAFFFFILEGKQFLRLF